MTEDPLNPYAAPKSDVSLPVSSDTEAARHLLLKHEATAKSVGTLFILGSLFAIYVGGASIYYASLMGFGGQMAYSWLLVAMGLVQFWVALGLRKLNPKARIPGLIFGVLGLVSFFIVSPGAEGTAGNTVGIIITLYILYILGCDKGRRVFSEEYARVIAATPHIKYRSPLLVRVLLWLLLAIIGLVIVAAFLK